MKLIKELGKMMYNFIKPHTLNEKILEMPNNVRNMGIKMEIGVFSSICFYA